MLINCPECSSVYSIEEDIIPEKGKKLRCAKCGKIWLAKKEDAIEPVKKTSENFVMEDVTEHDIESTINEVEADEPAPVTENDNELSAEPKDSEESGKLEESEDLESDKAQDETEIKDIFNRLATQTQEIFAHDKNNKVKKITSETLGLSSKINRLFFTLVIILIVMLSLFYARFNIVRTLPFTGKMYSALGIKATIPGYGLEFQNVIWKEFEEDYILKLEIRGFIVNTTNYRVDVANIHIEMMDENANIIQSVDDKIPSSFVPENERIPFKVVITKPSPLTKYVLLTFTD